MLLSKIDGPPIISFDKLPIYSPDEAPRPIRASVIEPATHMPMSLIKIERDEDGVPMAKFPPNWKSLGFVVYLWIDAKGKQLIGSSVDFEGRFSCYLSSFRGKGAASKLSLPKAVRKGTDVCVGIAMVCSSKESMKQNETSLIVQKRLAGYALHNVLNGEGDPTIILGSPTADGRGGQIPKKLMPSPVAIDRSRPEITDTSKWTPPRYFPVTLNEEGTITVDVPDLWKTLASVIYVFMVEGEDGVERRLIGETGRPIWKRVSEYKGAFNGKGPSCDLPLPVAVREAVLDERKVKFSIIGVCSPDAKTRKKFEAHFIVVKNSLTKGNGFNQRLEASPSRPARSLYQPPSPYQSPSPNAQPSSPYQSPSPNARPSSPYRPPSPGTKHARTEDQNSPNAMPPMKRPRMMINVSPDAMKTRQPRAGKAAPKQLAFEELEPEGLPTYVNLGPPLPPSF